MANVIMAPRTEGDSKPLRWQITSRTDTDVVTPVDLTGATVVIFLVDKPTQTHLTNWGGASGLDITASVSTPLTGLIDHEPTAAQVTDLVPDFYEGQLFITDAASETQFYPSDKVGEDERKRFELQVFTNLQ